MLEFKPVGEQQGKKPKTAVAMLCALVIVAVGVSVWWWYIQHKSGHEPTRNDQHEAKPVYTPKLKVDKVEVADNTVPEGMPQDIPQELNAEVIRNYTATTPEGAFQATREYISKLTIDENVTLFQKYFKDNGWKVVPVYKDKRSSAVTASKDKSLINVSFSPDAQSKAVLVKIDFTKAK